MEQKEKKRRGRRGYLADFRQTVTGEYVYEGTIHRFEGPGSWKKNMAGLWGLALVLLGAAAAAGLIPAPGIVGTAYITIPYALSLVCAISVVWLMARWTLGGQELRDYVYRATVGQVKLRGWAAAGFAAIALVGEIVYLIGHGWGAMAASAAGLLVALTVELVTVAVWTWLAGRLRWSK